MAKANSIAVEDGWRDAVERIGSYGVNTMADPKFHDIPETVRLSVRACAKWAPTFVTVHASGGPDMLKAAVEGRNEARDFPGMPLDPKVKEQVAGILAITVLTSLDGETCKSIFGAEPEEKVVEFAKMAHEAGIDGIVCSGKELRAIRAISALDDLITVVPGITPAWAKKAGDQKRIVTPTEAVESGADFIVVGRAITQPPADMTPGYAAGEIARELAEIS
jgi:orotidine-5'-phosphate decarboxylase